MGARVEADTITLEASNDTTLNAGKPDNNLGGSTTLIVGTTAVGVSNRALVRFDVAAAVPAKAVIASVRVSLVDVSHSRIFKPSHFEFHRVMVNWGEGKKSGPLGGVAAEGEATWRQRFSTNRPWAAPGGSPGNDYAAQPSVSLAMEGGLTNTWGTTPQLVADVQNWLDNPMANFGWLILSDREGSSGTSRRFASREASGREGPRLEIEFAAGR